MRRSLFPILLLMSGCFSSDKAAPILCKTNLPDTNYTVILFGSLPEIGYQCPFYTVSTPDGDTGLRELGDVSLDEPVTPKLEDIGDGIFRVTWQTAPNEVFSTIDTQQGLIVEDSNRSNGKNVPLETPRYLRPGYPPGSREAANRDGHRDEPVAPPDPAGG